MSEAPNPPAGPDDRKVRQVELLISTILRAGVVISLAVVILGMVVTFAHHREYIHSRQDLARLTSPARADFPHNMAEMCHGLRKFEGRSIVVAGLLLLIATPVMRVAVSIFAFVYEKDLGFVVITSIVLVMLIFSFVVGTAG